MGDKKYSLGITLSGGGIRAVSHLGVLKALLERGLKPEIVSGASMGSIIGALYADGCDIEETIEKAIEYHVKTKKFVNSRFSSESIMKMEGLISFLEKNVSVTNIEELKTPLIIAATNLDTARIEYFTKGNLLQAVLASSSIPLIFHPVTIGKHRYVDAGVVENMPVKPIREKCEYVIGVHSNPVPVDGRKIKGFAQIAERTFHLAIRANILEDKQYCDTFIEIEGLEKFGILDFKNMKAVFKLGYEETLKILDKDENIQKFISGNKL
ncbi:patatin-like phospholipase family protein [Bacteroidales bacterium OttesenSCG-928-C19]|nr:patatin-like phospholipase family protein [Bacteroidales bacterium OttesenSCG-928-C19]